MGDIYSPHGREICTAAPRTDQGQNIGQVQCWHGRQTSRIEPTEVETRSPAEIKEITWKHGNGVGQFKCRTPICHCASDWDIRGSERDVVAPHEHIAQIGPAIVSPLRDLHDLEAVS